MLTDTDLDEIHRAIGHFTVNWAWLESALDSCNLLFYARCDGKDKIEKQLPRPLERRLQFFDKSLNELPKVARFKEAGLALSGRIRSLKRDRHDAVHGFILDWNPETKVLSRSIYEMEQTTAKTRDHSVSIAQLDSWARETARLTADMMDFTRSLLDGVAKP